MISQSPPPTVVENIIESDAGIAWTDWVAIVMAVAALVITLTSFWWLHARKGRLRVMGPHEAGIHQAKNRALFVLRLPLSLQNTGAQTFVVSDMECWLPGTEQALPLSWGMTCESLRATVDYTEDAPVPIVVPSRQTASVIMEFRAPMPGFTISAGTHEVLVRALVDGEYRDLLRFDLTVLQPTLDMDKYSVISLRSDPYGQNRANQAAVRLLEHLKGMAQQQPTVEEPTPE